MSGFLNASLNQSLLQEIEMELCNILSNSIKQMISDLSKAKKKIKNVETEIRDQLVVNYLDNDEYRNKHNICEYKFEPETKVYGATKTGFADIKILIKDISFTNTSAFYVAECKRLDKSKKLIKYYVNNGIVRFAAPSHYYSTYNNSAFMIGFVVDSTKISECVAKLNAESKLQPNLTILAEIILHNSIYQSCYAIRSKNIAINHLFFDCSNIIS